MGQQIVIEIDDDLPIREREAEQIASLIYTIADTDEGISRLELEIESEAILNIAPLTDIEYARTRVEEESEEAESEEVMTKDAQNEEEEQPNS